MSQLPNVTCSLVAVLVPLDNRELTLALRSPWPALPTLAGPHGQFMSQQPTRPEQTTKGSPRLPLTSLLLALRHLLKIQKGTRQMIETKEGTKIEFKRLDEWCIRMTVSKKQGTKYVEIGTAILTIQDLCHEINLLQNSKPVKPKKGAKKHEPQ